MMHNNEKMEAIKNPAVKGIWVISRNCSLSIYGIANAATAINSNGALESSVVPRISIQRNLVLVNTSPANPKKSTRHNQEMI